MSSSPARLPRFLIPLMLINLTAHMALSGGRVSGSLFILKNGQAEIIVGVFMALFSIVPMFTALAVGRWVDRVGAARVMRFGMSLVLVGAWLPVILLTVPTLFLTAVLIGFGFNMLQVGAQHTVGHLNAGATSAERLTNFGWFALGHSASSALGPFASGFAIDHFGFTAAFALLASCSCISAILVFASAPPSTVSSNPKLIEGNTTKKDVFDLLNDPSLRRIYWVNMVMSISWDLFIVMLPILGVRQGFSASVIGVVFSLFALGTFASRACMPWLATRTTEWVIVRGAIGVIALVFISLPWMTSALLLMIAGFIFGAAVGLSQPNMLSLVHAASPPHRAGEAVGLRSVIGNTCSVAVPLAFGGSLAVIGLPVLLTASGVFFATALPAAHRAVRGS